MAKRAMIPSPLDETDVRERAMSYAVQTAEIGECPSRILARAALYADFILSPGRNGAAGGGDIMVQADKLLVDRR